MKESAGSGTCTDRRSKEGRKAMTTRRITAMVLVLVSLVFAGTVFASEPKLEMSEAAREEIKGMGDAAYLSVFELGSG
jgi:succinate dehydrogenase hydrophobic anchor subunit